ncbi:glycosyltransferase family 2 protein [Methylobacterium sp. J-076]|uniref:glycosyltransferase family 2 protein n=1 Tax=Methylobacterium sp. J-076 TaxID=2836655 RepID=UPI001FBAA6BA|nr:glycosyltransferase family 2 protein [Methylobacterium sp. J-076]MCJ2013390.1 glycosyltransferase [Methylobacterium sp. J-076]
MRLSVVICTFERPALLAALLRSLIGQGGTAGGDVEIVVVDNSDGETARPAVEALAAAAPMPLRYLTAHPANISVARNAGCRASRGEAVAFLDDDQQAEPGWLAAVLDGLERFPHDAFFGPITPHFEDPTAVTPAARTLFTRAWTEPAGREVFALRRPASQPFVVSTANSIFRRSTTLMEPEPFDPDFGQCGGEDLHLLSRLAREGRRFAWLPEARATDFVPRHRCGTGYLVRRHFAGGQAYAATVIRTSPRPLRDEAVLTAKSLVQVGMLPLTGIAMLRREAPGRSLAIRAAGIAGKLLWRRLYPLYRAEAASLAPLPTPAGGRSSAAGETN